VMGLEGVTHLDLRHLEPCLEFGVIADSCLPRRRRHPSRQPLELLLRTVEGRIGQPGAAAGLASAERRDWAEIAQKSLLLILRHRPRVPLQPDGLKDGLDLVQEDLLGLLRHHVCKPKEKERVTITEAPHHLRYAQVRIQTSEWLDSPTRCCLFDLVVRVPRSETRPMAIDRLLLLQHSQGSENADRRSQPNHVDLRSGGVDSAPSAQAKPVSPSLSSVSDLDRFFPPAGRSPYNLPPRVLCPQEER
jgi:hypothetical protein